MSYLNRRTRSMSARPLPERGRRLRNPVVRTYQPWAMGDAASDACYAQGQAAQQQFTDAWTQIDHAWNNTTGFYAIADMQAVFNQAFKFVSQATSMLDQHRATYGDTGPDFVIQALDQSYNRIFVDEQNGLDFQHAINDAVNSGATIVNAPGFKQWVADMMIDAGQAAFVVAYTNACEPAYAASIIAVMRALITMGNGILNAVEQAASVAANLAITAADVVYKTTVGTLDLVGEILQYLPWVAGGVGVWWLWKEFGKDLVGKK